MTSPQDSHREYTIIGVFLPFAAYFSENSDKQVGLRSVNPNGIGIQGNLLFFEVDPVADGARYFERSLKSSGQK